MISEIEEFFLAAWLVPSAATRLTAADGQSAPQQNRPPDRSKAWPRLARLLGRSSSKRSNRRFEPHRETAPLLRRS
jgi:hypothetical protein